MQYAGPGCRQTTIDNYTFEQGQHRSALSAIQYAYHDALPDVQLDLSVMQKIVRVWL